jgi:hypothetical protein
VQKANNPSKGVKKTMIAYNKKSLDVVFIDSNIDILGAPPVRRVARR